MSGIGSSSSRPVPSSTAAGAISGLHVVDNTILNASSQQVVLHGVNKSGTEYACIQGNGIFDPRGSDSVSAIKAMKAWTGVNAVRIPMNEDCWLAINGAPAAYSGANYRNAIETLVDRLVQLNLVPILDLHWTAPGTQQATGQQPMPDEDHSVVFWKQVATEFGNNSAVIFDVFNEPYPDNNTDTDEAWRCWKSGGTCTGISFPVAGMQSLVTTIRATGATNVLMLGGVEYSNALTQWTTHEPTDPLKNLAASWHMYGGTTCSTETCWDEAPAQVATQVPLIAGEFGESYDGSDCTNSLVTTFTNWMDARKLSYLAWTWDSWGSCLSLVSNVWTGAPTSWGSFYKGHVAQF